MQIQIPAISKEEAKKFSGVWTHNGVAIILNDTHLQFASDFANVVLRSFVQHLMAQQAAEAAAQVKQVVQP